MRTIEARIRDLSVLALIWTACDQGAELNSTSPPQRLGALSGSPFESSDGNLVVDGASPATDWANAPALVIAEDLPPGQSDNAFGQGAKEDLPVPAAVLGSIPKNKSDLTRWYLAHEEVGTHTFLYLAWERANALGTANLNFEFNQSSLLTANDITPVRTAGDMLITFDWTSGGQVVKLGLLTWLAGSDDPSLCYGSRVLPCWGRYVDLNASAAAEGSVNDTASVYDPHLDADLSPRTFGEAAIDLTLAGVLDPDTCVHFGQAFVKSRSSTSFSAELKDFIAPIPVNIDNCKPVHVKLQKFDLGGSPLAGAAMQLWLDDGDGVIDAGDTLVGNCLTAADGVGTCNFTVTQDGTYIGREVTPPNGYSAAPDQSVAVTLTNAEQFVTLTFANTPVPGRIVIRKIDDLGAPIAGATFELRTDAAPLGTAPGEEDVAMATCTTDEAGACAFEGLLLGDYWVVETGVPVGYFPADPPYQGATIGLGSSPGVGMTVSRTFVDARTFRVIVLVCQGPASLYPSTVSVDGLPSQLTSDLVDPSICMLATGNFGDLATGAHQCTIDIPQ
jgi:hypothetical protein